ncbi:interferon-induced protein 44-like isoform X1 [Astyanax mexicanus]|uniref:Interferon-induced protein 44-like isoform X1 n=1 Tax=Astyanax mexicanus TaxID=7994 RepID=A0A8T2LK35_ASTMX|nr:interferon-induced protein 44-like isoform X1 [Astyanax mexicanus]
MLRCEANTPDVTVTWMKDDRKLDCVDGKHSKRQIGATCYLDISNATEGDEGKYSVHLENSSGSDTRSCMVTVELKEWRSVQWNQDPMINKLRNFQISNEGVRELNFLLYGPVGAGKSSIINTIKSIFEGRQYIECLAAAESTTSQTIYFQKFSMAKDGSFPFAFSDIMGVEKELLEGVSSEDIISALKGHVKEGYTFNPVIPLTDPNEYYRTNPGPNDKIHCLINVMPADKLAMMADDFIKKMKQVRVAASRMNIPQVVFLTRIDRTCQMTKEDLHKVYKSKKIRDKMRQCSNTLGVPVNCIFPVWNYHEETGVNAEINCLMLNALTQIIPWANDYIVKSLNNQPRLE